MNFPLIRKAIGRLLVVMIVLLAFPLAVSIIYRESTLNKLSFLIPMVLVGFIGFILTHGETKERRLTSKDGLFICALIWILYSGFGALPFVISGQIPSFIDAFFETMSGFTTTGSSILRDVEALSHSMLFWRSFTHLVGGMGVLVFALAILPGSSGDLVHIMKAEVPGPTFGKIVSRLKHTARILYIMYLVMTLVLIIILALGPMNLFDSILHAFGAAGTGGFGIKNASVGFYADPYSEIVLGVAMIIFGVNFNLYYFILLGKVKEFFKSEELRVYLGIMFGAMALIFFNIINTYNSVSHSLRDIFFTVSSVMTTTGYSTADFGSWPLFSQFVLLVTMFVGGMAGSTAGGLKVSRIILMFKSAIREVRHVLQPHRVQSIQLEANPVQAHIVRSVGSYFILYMFIFFIIMGIITLDSPDFMTAFSATAATFNNIGPGLAMAGPTSNFAMFNDLSKVGLTFSMFFGRLELIPVVILFMPSTYKRS